MNVWTLIAAEGDTRANPLQLPFMLILMFAVVYLLLIRPQKKRDQERRAMIAAISKNDKVVTQGGIIGVVTNTKDDEVTIRIDDEKNVRIRVRRDFITGVLNDADAAAKKASA